MPTSEPVEFAFEGEANGTPISPENVPFGLMRRFHKEVEKLVLGSNKGSLNDVVVRVKEGSYGLAVPIPASVEESFTRDMAVAHDPNGSTTPDPIRLSVLIKWQHRSTVERGLSYFVRPSETSQRFQELKIDANTSLKKPPSDQWLPVELMLLGKVREAGGENANIHVQLRDIKEPVIVSINWAQLENEKFPFTGEKLMRVSAKRNLRTKELGKFKLIEFISYSPQFDETAFTRMITAGKEAWQNVPDASSWVREQRGHDNA